MSKQQRVNAMVCSDCWYDLRPTEYLPARGGNDFTECVRCGSEWDTTYRVSWAEVEANPDPTRKVIINEQA